MSKKKMSKKNKKTKNSIYINICGLKVNGTILVAMAIMLILLAINIPIQRHRKNLLENGNTIVVNAEIVDVGKRTRGGLGFRPKVGYIKYKYYIENKMFIRAYESFYISNNIEKYHIGDCIEVIVSLDDEEVYEWNKSKGTFKCEEQDDI